MINVSPFWGHPLETPEGEEIRVPKWAFPKLRRLGLLDKNRARLMPSVWLLIQPKFDTLTDGLRMLLGVDLSGPAWCRCNCRECQKEKSDIDHTRLPGRNRLEQDEAAKIVREVKRRRIIQ